MASASPGMSGMIAFRWTIAHFALVVGWSLLVAVCSGRAADGEADDGLFITVQNPITDATLTQIKNNIDRAIHQQGRHVKKVVFDFNPGDSEAATPNYGSCRDFADYIKTLNQNGTYTIAFVHAKTYRHTVLPVIACNDLAMSSGAKIGEVAEATENVPFDVTEMYARTAGVEREAAVLKMLNKNVAVVSGRLKGAPINVDLAKIGKKDTPFEDVFVNQGDLAKPFLPAGNIGLYNLETAMKLRLCIDVPLENWQAVAEKYNLSPSSMWGDRYRSGKIKAVKIGLTGPIDDSFHQKLKTQLKDVRARKENTIFFVMEYGGECGGSARIAREIADEIRDLKNDEKDPIWSVAFIPNKAPDLATFIAFACSEIIMFKGSDASREATIGDFEPFLNATAKGSDPSNTAEGIRRNLAEIAEQQGYSQRIVDGMLNRDTSIVQVRDKNKPGDAHEVMTGREYEAAKLKKDAQIVLIKTIKQPGALLVLNTTQAKELRIAATTTVDNKDPKEVYTLYGLTEKDVRDSKPGFLDDFAAFLRRTEIIFLLLAVAFAALILEFKMPGATIPGIVSLIGFMLFFWSQAYANGATIYLAIGLFVLGLLMLGVEIFILPGFGIMGIGGVILILSSLGLATMEKAPTTSEEWLTFGSRLAQYASYLFVSCIFGLMAAKYLHMIPYVNRMMLVPPSDNPDIDSEASVLPGAEQAAALLGLVGTATSMLRPAGMAKIGDAYVDVVTEGDFIAPGTPIQVIEVEGTRIVVKKM